MDSLLRFIDLISLVMRELADYNCAFLLLDFWVFFFDKLMKWSRKSLYYFHQKFDSSDGKELTFVLFFLSFYQSIFRLSL